jgi:hypothetical protein
VSFDFNTTAGRTSGTGAVAVRVELFGVQIAKLVPGVESCTGSGASGSTGTCPPPVETLFLTFDKIEVQHGTDAPIRWDLTTETSTSPRPTTSDLNDAFNFFMNSGTASQERATSFRGPIQTPGGVLVEATVGPRESDQSDSGIDRRPTRLLALLRNVPIPSGQVHVNNSVSTLDRQYDMTNIRFSSITYTGVAEKLAFAIESITWTIGPQRASFP